MAALILILESPGGEGTELADVHFKRVPNRIFPFLKSTNVAVGGLFGGMLAQGTQQLIERILAIFGIN